MGWYLRAQQRGDFLSDLLLARRDELGVANQVHLVEDEEDLGVVALRESSGSMDDFSTQVGEGNRPVD